MQEKAAKKMRKRGLVWNHFAPLEDERAKCNVCPAVISYKRGSTSNLLRHMKKKHPQVDVQDEDPLKADILNELSGGEEAETVPVSWRMNIRARTLPYTGPSLILHFARRRTIQPGKCCGNEVACGTTSNPPNRTRPSAPCATWSSST